MSDHAFLSPSAAARWFACPASPAMARRAALAGLEPVAGPAAVQGAAVHAVAHGILSKGCDAWEFAGTTVAGVTVSHEDAMNAEGFAAICQVHTAADGSSDCGSEVAVGDRSEPVWGTLDYYVLDKDALHVFDYKNGARQVEAENNEQLMLYACLFLRERDLWESVSSVFLHIVQRDYADPGNPLERVAETTPAFLRYWWDAFVQPAIEAALADEPVAVARLDGQCRWCPGKAVCPACAKAVGDAVSTAEAECAELSAVTDFGPLLERLKALAEVHKQVAVLAKEALLAGAPCTGFKLVAGRAKRGWRPGAGAAALEAFGPKAMTEPELRSPAQIEKLALGRAFAKEWALPGEGAPTVVAESDSRAAIQSPRTAEAMFPVETERSGDVHRNS